MTETNEALAAEAGLRYVHDDTPGIRRVRAARVFAISIPPARR
jgi:hypothetical protein